MANSESVLSIVASCRRETSQINSPTFSDTVELIPWVRDSLKQLYEVMTQRWMDWYVVQRPLTLVPNVERYSLPSDCRYVTAVYMVYTNGFKQQLKPWQREQYGRTSYNLAGPTLGWPLTYRVMGNRIIFQPRPTQTYTNAIEIHYAPQWSGPLLNWSTIDNVLPNGWEAWVKLDVMIKMRMKMNLDTGDAQNAKAEVQQRIIAGARERTGDAPMMRDVYAPSVISCYNGGTPGGNLLWVG